MLPEEREICAYLKSFPGQFVSAREIARRAGGKWRFRENPQWSVPFLTQLQEKKVIETDSAHNYRIIAKKESKPRRWLSPQMRKILESNGNFTHVIEDEDLPADE